MQTDSMQLYTSLRFRLNAAHLQGYKYKPLTECESPFIYICERKHKNGWKKKCYKNKVIF